MADLGRKRVPAKKPLAQCDPDSAWEPEARRLGLTVAALRRQVALADEIIEEIFAEERMAQIKT